MKITRALLSVSDKSGIVDFAKFLHKNGVEIVSTGGTAAKIRDAGVPVKDISEITNFPEMLDGRVKTLHPKIHGGILFLRGNDEHEKTVAEHEIGAIDLVVVNLYPFLKTPSIENIDIGGPSMLRSAAKNFESVTVVVDPADLKIVEKEILENGGTTRNTREYLAGKVFATTAKYDAAIAKFFNPDFEFLSAKKVSFLKYGENPHQNAELWRAEKIRGASLLTAKKSGAAPMGFCNFLDADAALGLVLEFDEPAAAIIKHATPCGAAIAENVFDAYQKALAADPVSAFGGIVAVNREIDEKTAAKMTEHFLEVVIAPKISPKAREIFTKKDRLRVLEIENFEKPRGEIETRSVAGGFLRQNRDEKIISEKDLTQIVGKWDQNEITDALFAWKVVKWVKSNAIVIAKNGATVGIGGGQTSRVSSSKIAVDAAGKKAIGAVAASDAFFPFSDGVEFLADAGVGAIIQPGGSKRDAEVFAAAEKRGVKMALTGIRAFRH